MKIQEVLKVGDPLGNETNCQISPYKPEGTLTVYICTVIPKVNFIAYNITDQIHKNFQRWKS